MLQPTGSAVRPLTVRRATVAALATANSKAHIPNEIVNRVEEQLEAELHLRQRDDAVQRYNAQMQRYNAQMQRYNAQMQHRNALALVGC